MPDARKRAALCLAQRHDIVIFEDDIYGELATRIPAPAHHPFLGYRRPGDALQFVYQNHRSRPAHRLDCPRPLLRSPAADEICRQRYQRPSTQLAACNFIREGHYHRHVRRMRQIYQRNMEIYTCWLREFFPCGICVTRPKGGFMLWVELPEQVDMVCVAKQLCRLKIQVAPGSLFSASGKYRNCLRINCALPPTDKHKEVMVQLGMAVKVAT